MKYVLLGLVLGLGLVACKQQASQQSGLKQSASSNTSHLEFFDEDGYPLMRGSFTVVRKPYCFSFGEVPEGKTLKDMVRRGSVTTYFFNFSGAKPERVQSDYKYETPECMKNGKLKEEDTTPLKTPEWTKVEVHGKKALYSESNAIIDYGKKMCFLVEGAGIESEPVFCSSIIYNMKPPLREVEEDIATTQ